MDLAATGARSSCRELARSPSILLSITGPPSLSNAMAISKHTATRSEPKVTATPGLSEASWTAFFEGRFQSGDAVAHDPRPREIGRAPCHARVRARRRSTAVPFQGLIFASTEPNARSATSVSWITWARSQYPFERPKN